MQEEDLEPTSIDDILSDEPPVQEAVEVEQPLEQVETAPEVATDAPAEPIQTEAEPTPAQPNDWTYAAYSDEKTKRQAAEKRADELEARHKAWEYQQAQNQKPVEVPDMLVDPNGYTQHVQQQALAPVMPVIHGLQRQVAAQVHGADKLENATAWFNTLPPQHQSALNQHYGQTADPYGGLIAEFEKVQIAKEFSDPETIAAFKAWQTGQVQAQAPAQAAPVAPVAPRPSQVQLTPSVMSAPSVAPRSGGKWAGPTSLESILPE